MSSTVEDVFNDKKKVLIGYLPIGFPSLQGSIDAAVAMVRNGVDIIEFGIPYSDPVMDGLIIQNATQKALANGFKLSDAFEAVRAVTQKVDAPVLVMTYFNPVFQYGVERFAHDLAKAGGAGLITPDLVPDEAHEWIAAADKYDLDRVFLAAPSSTDERLRSVIQNSRGFVYAVSTMGITGTRTDVDTAARALVDRLYKLKASYVGVGVGISNSSQVSEVLNYSQGAIVGSAFVSSLTGGGVEALSHTVREIATGKPELV